jgi:Flp pilus assembly protein TadB
VSDLQVAATVPVLLVLAALAARRALRTGHLTVEHARRVLAGVPVRSGADDRWASDVRRPTDHARRRLDGWSSALAAGWSGRTLERRLGLGPDGTVLLGRSVTDHVGRVLAIALTGAFAALVALATAGALGALPVTPWSLLLVPVVAAAGAWMVVSDVRSELERRRRELRRAVGELLQLLAVGLTTDQSVDEAMSYALAVGAGPGFDRLRSTLRAAPVRGVSLWEALDELGRTCARPELVELAGSIERHALHGISILETVTSMAATDRARSLDELERDADRANANLAGPTTAFVVTTVVFLAYPLALRISEAFHGR